METQDYIDGVLKQNRRIVAKTITLIESSLAAHQEKAKTIVDALLPYAGQAVRIGITGVPGVGKSTYIESFGLQLVKQGHRVAVLAVDPSSSKKRRQHHGRQNPYGKAFSGATGLYTAISFKRHSGRRRPTDQRNHDCL
jgi:hypothetical protein